MIPPLELLLFVVASAAVPAAAVLVFLYLQSSFRLLELVKDREPVFWRHLGSPDRTWVRDGYTGGIHTITPIGPWLSWIWSGQAALRAPDIARALVRTRLLLRSGLAAFVACVGVIGALIAVAS